MSPGNTIRTGASWALILFAALVSGVWFSCSVSANCGSRVPPPDLTGKEEPVVLKLTDLNQKSMVHDSERVLIKGTIVEFDSKSARGGRSIKGYRLSADGLAVELMGKEARRFVGQTVTIQGFMRIFGDPRKEGIAAFKLSIEKIIQ